MGEYGFEWDDDKAAENLRKHGVSFEEAVTVFADSRRIETFDEEHSGTEDRYLAIGMSNKARLLVVGYTPRGANIFSADRRSEVCQPV